MPISPYMQALRERIGNDLVLVPSVTALIRDDAGRILIQLTATETRWSLPGGAIDPGETPAAAVVREVWEETGLEVVPVRIAGVLGGADYRYTYDNGDRVEYIMTIFECRVTGGELGGHDGETAALRWAPVEELDCLAVRYPPEVFAVEAAAWFERP